MRLVEIDQGLAEAVPGLIGGAGLQLADRRRAHPAVIGDGALRQPARGQFLDDVGPVHVTLAVRDSEHSLAVRGAECQFAETDAVNKPSRPIHRTDFGQRLHDARVAAGLSQRDACRALGLSPPTLSEAERYSQGSSHVARFARLYGMSAEWLSTGEGLREAAGEADAFGPRLSPAALEIAQQFDAAPKDRKRVLYAVLLDEIRRFSRPADTPTPPPGGPPSAAPRPGTKKARARRPF